MALFGNTVVFLLGDLYLFKFLVQAFPALSLSFSLCAR